MRDEMLADLAEMGYTRVSALIERHKDVLDGLADA
jgi:hypothetical protein